VQTELQVTVESAFLQGTLSRTARVWPWWLHPEDAIIGPSSFLVTREELTTDHPADLSPFLSTYTLDIHSIIDSQSSSLHLNPKHTQQSVSRPYLPSHRTYSVEAFRTKLSAS
jgi:hypothetical protein